MNGALDKLLADTESDPTLLAVILFGSSARDEATPASDIDVCLVVSERNPTPLWLSEKKLKYASRHPALDVQVFQQLPLYVRHRVLRDGRVLWTRDEDALYDLAYQTAREFDHFRPRYEEHLRSVEDARS